MSLPTSRGSMWLYSSSLTFSAEACSPALWANDETPTYAWWVFGGRLVMSARAWLIRLDSRRLPSGRALMPSFSSRLATTENRSALPVRSP